MFKNIISKQFRGSGLGELVGFEEMTGDASNRRYYRGYSSTGASYVIMQLAEPLAIKKAEEAFSGTSGCNIKELPFINILSFLEKLEVPVPRLYSYDEKAGALILEDFGDITLEQKIGNAGKEEISALYHKAVGELCRMQKEAGDKNGNGAGNCLAFYRQFDGKLLMWEFEHYLEYGVEAYYKKEMGSSEKEAVRAIFSRLSRELEGRDYIFTHRDYHSRNLMVTENNGGGQRLGIIDFQDALWGPLAYDLASLLRDSYTELQEELVSELLRLYWGEMKGNRLSIENFEEFERLFDITALHRNMKAAGRFVYIHEVKGNDKFLKYIQGTLKKIARCIKKHDDLSQLGELLGHYVKELG